MSKQQIISCMVVDDEPHAIELLELYIKKTNFLALKNKETDPWKAISYLKENKVDLLFLDIQMEGLTGLQVLDVLEERPNVILTTAYSEYALKGYEYQVSDYLLKPYSFDRFHKAVLNIQDSLNKKAPNIESDKSNEPQDFIFIKGDAKNKFHRIQYDNILYVEGLRNYVQFHCTNEKIITLNNMKSLEEELPSDQFVRIHKSYIINVNRINMVEGSCIHIADKSLPIGASYKKDFLTRFRK